MDDANGVSNQRHDILAESEHHNPSLPTIDLLTAGSEKSLPILLPNDGAPPQTQDKPRGSYFYHSLP